MEIDNPVFKMSANTLRGNNTGSTANSLNLTVAQIRTLLGISFTAEQTIPGTVIWSGTAPTGETKTYMWSQNAGTRQVTFVCNLTYTSAGATNTTVSIPLPTDMPNPVVPTGLTGANVILYTGTSLISTGITTATNPFQSTIRRNAADNGFNIVGSASAGVAAKYATITITYFY